MIKNFDLSQIIDSGQVFRAWKNSDNTYTFISGTRKIILSDNDEIIDPYWQNYFDLNTDYSNFIIDSTDLYLNKAVEYGKGIRILNQDLWEILISFIISQQNNIPRIKNCIEKLCLGCGINMGDYYTFPTPSGILEFGIGGLRNIGLGYRAEYIYRAAHEVIFKKINLDAWVNLSDSELYKNLVSIYGVGPKVANCIMLFGYHRLNAFPIDTWIKKIINREYNGNFDISKYQNFAGIIQQYMYYYERSAPTRG